MPSFSLISEQVFSFHAPQKKIWGGPSGAVPLGPNPPLFKGRITKPVHFFVAIANNLGIAIPIQLQIRLRLRVLIDRKFASQRY